mmetsp:Transcript_61310/g.162978  ORF Transcript_61310/g.162978 Transcript_61310/m.162978 type:complete len:207 (-) Transcript_61310:156-776(-)
MGLPRNPLRGVFKHLASKRPLLISQSLVARKLTLGHNELRLVRRISEFCHGIDFLCGAQECSSNRLRTAVDAGLHILLEITSSTLFLKHFQSAFLTRKPVRKRDAGLMTFCGTRRCDVLDCMSNFRQLFSGHLAAIIEPILFLTQESRAFPLRLPHQLNESVSCLIGLHVGQHSVRRLASQRHGFVDDAPCTALRPESGNGETRVA